MILHAIDTIENAFTASPYASTGVCVAASKAGIDKDEDNPKRLVPFVWIDVFNDGCRDREVTQGIAGNLCEITARFWVLIPSDLTKQSATRLSTDGDSGRSWSLHDARAVADAIKKQVALSAPYIGAGQRSLSMSVGTVLNAFDANYDGLICTLDTTIEITPDLC